MCAKVLIVEDEDALTQLLSYNLAKEGYDIAACDDGDDVMMMIDEERPDIVLLDWMLPNRSGVEICRQIRALAETRDLPVIMLTARGEEGDRIRGLELGADDYVTKPFSMSELVARMRAVLRRSRPMLAGEVARFADITLDRGTRRVRRAGREVHLGPTEFRLLDVLMGRPGRVFSREQLLDRVWGADIYVESRTVDVHVRWLREKIEINPSKPTRITTIPELWKV